MPTSISFDHHLAALRSSGDRLGDLADAAGEEARVPTCPSWDIRALLAHQTMVHRWATANVTGTDPAELPTQTEIRTSIDDIAGYYAEGLDALVDALAGARADLRADVFLNDAPAPREFWARRQAHETCVHMVDALAAVLARHPTAAEAAIDPRFAVDGIDELLAGFFTRGMSKLYDGRTFAILVAPDDAVRAWHVRVDECLTVETEPASTPEVTVTGTASAIYLGLWNRGDELVVEGDPALVDRWRMTQRVRWS